MTLPQRIAWVWGVLAAAAPAVAAGADLEIVEPAGGLRTWMPVTVTLDLVDTADTGTLAVTLNGTDISSAFVFAPPAGGRIEAQALSFWDPDVVQQGSNVLEASVGVSGSTAEARRSFVANGDPFADAVVDVLIGTDGGEGGPDEACVPQPPDKFCWPENVLGPPRGLGLNQGSLDTVSLGRGGMLILEFVDNVAWNGPGVDLLVFENPFLVVAGDVTQPPFMEPARVSVSQDGESWVDFPGCALDPAEAVNFHPGCAGVYPVLSRPFLPFSHGSIPSTVPIQDLVGKEAATLPLPAGAGGDAFDLDAVGLDWIKFVKVESAGFAPQFAEAPKIGSDIDAVAAVYSQLPPTVPALPAAGLGWLALLLLGSGGIWLRHSSRSRKLTGTTTRP